MTPAPTPLRVLVAGGGVAALESVLALRALAGDRVTVELLAPGADFAHRPYSVRSPFTGDDVPQISFDRTHVTHHRRALAGVDADRPEAPRPRSPPAAPRGARPRGGRCGGPPRPPRRSAPPTAAPCRTTASSSPRAPSPWRASTAPPCSAGRSAPAPWRAHCARPAS